MSLRLIHAGVILIIGPLALTLAGAATMKDAPVDLGLLRVFARRITPMHTAKRKPQAGDWLATHEEAGQTFDEYAGSDPNRPTAQQMKLYIQPLGDFPADQQQLMQETAELLSRFYGVPSQVLQPLGLNVIPQQFRRVHPEWGDPQILTTYVLDQVLKPRRPKDAVALLALTSSDLWPGEGWNFVFGQASLHERVGVWSFYRYGDPRDGKEAASRFRRRVFKIALHETGHIFGIAHCIRYECGMNGSNHLIEMDHRPLHFCPDDELKIWWACHVDPAGRYERLAEFASRHGLDDEAQFWKAARASLD